MISELLAKLSGVMPELDFMVWGVVLCGLAVGFLAGLLGVGGGFVMAPLVNGLFGVPMPIISGSSICQISGTSLAGMLRHRKHGNTDTRIAVVMIGGMLCGTVTGAKIVKWLKSLGTVTLGGGDFAAAELWLRWIFLVTLTIIGVIVLFETTRASRKARRSGGAEQKTAGLLGLIPLPLQIMPAGGSRPVSVILVSYCGVIIGIAQGMLGIGGGVLLIPVLVYLIGVSIHAAVGTSLLVILISSFAGTFMHVMDGNVHLWLVLAMLLPSTFGSQLGAIVASRISGHGLRRYFAVVVAASALLLGWKLYGMYHPGPLEKEAAISQQAESESPSAR